MEAAKVLVINSHKKCHPGRSKVVDALGGMFHFSNPIFPYDYLSNNYFFAHGSVTQRADTKYTASQNSFLVHLDIDMSRCHKTKLQGFLDIR
jgi:hypothetical protein